MTVQDFLAEAVVNLKRADVTSARLDCLILLEDALEVDRSLLLAHPETQIPQAKLTGLNKKIVQRSKHTPLAYIRGRTAFFGREFVVNNHVLVPRPETEIMIEMLKNLPLPALPVVADIGCGSGCIGITAALELPGSKVELYDIDADALKVAAQNAKRLKTDVRLHQNNLLAGLASVDVLAVNLPYVPTQMRINRAAKHEPAHAIFSGNDGLDLYREFWKQAELLSPKPSFMLCESLPAQHSAMESLALGAGFHLIKTNDFIQLFTS